MGRYSMGLIVSRVSYCVRVYLAVVRSFLLLLLALLLFAAPAAAQDERAPVRVDGRTVFRVGPIDDVTAEARAERIESRLETLLATGEPIPGAAVEPLGPGTRSITIGGTPILTVTDADAEDNVTDLDTLAAEWAGALDDALRDAAQRRSNEVGAFFVLIESAFARLLESLRSVLPRVLAAAIVLLLFGLLATLVRRLLRLLFGHVEYDPTSRNLIKQLVYYGIWTLGIIVAVSAMGFDPQALATAIGLTSVALGFALKDVLSNFVSGLLLLFMRPFKIGDQIVVGSTEGAVDRIELRATRIITYDGRAVLVPNAELFTSRVTNNTAAPIRRDSIILSLAYDADLTAAMNAALDATRAASGVLEEPPPSILVRDLGATSIALELRFWTDSRRADFVATRSHVNADVVAALRAADVRLPQAGATTVVVSAPP